MAVKYRISSWTVSLSSDIAYLESSLAFKVNENLWLELGAGALSTTANVAALSLAGQSGSNTLSAKSTSANVVSLVFTTLQGSNTLSAKTSSANIAALVFEGVSGSTQPPATPPDSGLFFGVGDTIRLGIPVGFSMGPIKGRM